MFYGKWSFFFYSFDYINIVLGLLFSIIKYMSDKIYMYLYINAYIHIYIIHIIHFLCTFIYKLYIVKIFSLMDPEYQRIYLVTESI